MKMGVTGSNVVTDCVRK